MFERFPYTNVHELNLDWIINVINELKENSVVSVNGESGEVILYKDKNVVFPEVTDSDWFIGRTADGKEIGIKFDTTQGMMFLKYNGTTTPVYTGDNPPTYPVTSVNGQTGDVITYPENAIRFPDVSETLWNMRRIVDKDDPDHRVEGLQFEKDQPMVHINGTNRYPVYDQGNPPPYPVTSVNGQTGAVVLAFPVTSVNGQTGNVTINIPVTSVNGMTGAITLYTDANIRFPDVSDTSWNIRRVVDKDDPDHRVEGLEFQKDGPMVHINGTNRYNVYDQNNPPPYPVTSINGDTGDVYLEIPFDDSSDPFDDTDPIYKSGRSTSGIWGLERGTLYGKACLYLNTDSNNNLSAYITFLSNDEQTSHTYKLLTTNDIPSGSGVVSLNGQTGVVTLYGDTMPIVAGSPTMVKAYIDALASNMGPAWNTLTTYFRGAIVLYDGVLYRASVDINAGTWASQSAYWTAIDLGTLISDKSDMETLAFVEYDNNAMHNIAQGQLVYWKDKIYRATTAISVGDTLNTTVLDDGTLTDGLQAKGALNVLNDNLAKLSNATLLGSGGFGSSISLTDNPSNYRFLILAVRDASHNDFSLTIGHVGIITTCLGYTSSTARLPISVGNSSGACGCLTITSLTSNSITINNQAYSAYSRVDVYGV